MSVLIDTSVWGAHFKSRNDVLIELLEADLALTHPMVLVELACGRLPAPRTQTLNDISLLQLTHQASLSEVMDFIECEKLYGLGCGLVDMVPCLHADDAWYQVMDAGQAPCRFGRVFQRDIPK